MIDVYKLHAHFFFTLCFPIWACKKLITSIHTLYILYLYFPIAQFGVNDRRDPRTLLVLFLFSKYKIFILVLKLSLMYHFYRSLMITWTIIYKVEFSNNKFLKKNPKIIKSKMKIQKSNGQTLLLRVAQLSVFMIDI